MNKNIGGIKQLHLQLFRGAPELVSGRNPDFSEFRFRPELITKAWPEPELCRFQRDRISNVSVSNKVHSRKKFALHKGNVYY